MANAQSCELIEAGTACGISATCSAAVVSSIGGMGLVAMGGAAVAIGTAPIATAGGVLGLAGWAIAHLVGWRNKLEYGMKGFYRAICNEMSLSYQN